MHADEQDAKDGAEQLPAALARVPCERGRVGDLVQHPCRAGLGAPRHQLRAPMYACTPNAAVVRWPRTVAYVCAYVCGGGFYILDDLQLRMAPQLITRGSVKHANRDDARGGWNYLWARKCSSCPTTCALH